LNDGLVEIAPYSVWDHDTRENCVNDSQISKIIIERCTIDGGSVHDVLNANSPVSIILFSKISLIDELKELV
jgi:hypothetical protein